MGKKKSVVLLTLITIVIVALCAMIAVPSFDLPFPVNGAESTWHPVVDTYDFDEDLGGGYYTYYYPEGVISEAEYKTECESREGDADRLEEYTSSYTAHGGIYLSTDPDDGVVEEDGNGGYTVTESFRTSFEAAAKEIADRYAKKGYSSYRVSVVDDYAIRVSVPEYDISAGTTFQYFSYTGGFTLNDGTSDVFEEGRNVSASDYFRDFTGPLGCPSEFVNEDIEALKNKKMLFVAGGVGAAPVYPQVKWLHERGIKADVIVGSKTKDMLILEEEMKAVAGNYYPCTDDGSYGHAGMVTTMVEELVNNGNKYDVCIAIGPMIMMKFVCLLTKKLEIPTIVSMNPIMVDGTGMCGACRLQVGDEIKFACVDGPEFDGHLVDFDQAMKRSQMYKTQEGRALLKLQEGDTHHGGCGHCGGDE